MDHPRTLFKILVLLIKMYRIRTQIVGVEGKHAYHLTTTMAPKLDILTFNEGSLTTTASRFIQRFYWLIGSLKHRHLIKLHSDQSIKKFMSRRQPPKTFLRPKN